MAFAGTRIPGTFKENDMTMQKPNEINQLIGQFLDLQEQWEDSPDDFNWPALRELATAGANAYNEGNGPSFQILSLDGFQHGEFHLRFLEYSLEAGFDPFKLVQASSGQAMVAVFGHESLADAAKHNLWSASMQAILQNLARKRFASAVEIEEIGLSGADLARTIESCRDSIPIDVLNRLSNELLVAETAQAN
jgi:hypothetical protein